MFIFGREKKRVPTCQHAFQGGVMMHFPRIVLASLLAGAGVSVAFARQADVIEFRKVGDGSSLAAGARQGRNVLESMQEHLFAAIGNQSPYLSHGPRSDSAVPGTVPPSEGSQFFSPVTLSARGGSMPWSQFAASSPTSSLCDAAEYVPAWWMSADAELRRSAYYNTMAAIACEFALPTNLLDAVIAQESGYNPWAVSSAGAMGIMQIMPGTGNLLGLRNPFDPVANMRAGARYLRQQLDRFGRVDLALAAYNAGPERRSLQAGYIPAIPETRNYVRTITTNWARLAQLGVETTDAEIRANAAMTAVHASGYRNVELVRYDGLNAANPM